MEIENPKGLSEDTLRDVTGGVREEEYRPSGVRIPVSDPLGDIPEYAKLPIEEQIAMIERSLEQERAEAESKRDTLSAGERIASLF